jgi:hypothetical protein
MDQETIQDSWYPVQFINRYLPNAGFNPYRHTIIFAPVLSDTVVMGITLQTKVAAKKKLPRLILTG